MRGLPSPPARDVRMNDPHDLPTETMPHTGPKPVVPAPVPVAKPEVPPDETQPHAGTTPSVAGVPDQTIDHNEPPPMAPASPPPPRRPFDTGTIVAPPARALPSEGPETATLAAPAGYDPVALASTRAAGGEFKPMVFEAKEPLVGGRFEIVRPLARGGMGQVSVARDRELDRDVALKEIQPRFVSDHATTSRFVLEAMVTGQLEHPGIVPVYGRGERPNGTPYYAMRFVTGVSFQQAVDEFHELDKVPRDPRERSLAMRNLLRRFVDVCNTIGYAHAKGYLHRDIKPANVMLGAYGETLVVDWGLAKEMKAGASPGTYAPTPTETTPPTDDDDDQTKEGFTHYGQAMGTPAFMSPEQAAGQWDVTGVGSDVYSLGAMLYSILTGSPPYAGPTREVLTKVQRGEFRPIKLVKGNVPGPLDAICRKAMAFKIAERYPTSLALAADVDRWLADEPVSCYPEPWLVRAGRWAKRNRTAVAAAAVLLLTGTVALGVGLFAVNREKKKTELAYGLAAESRGETRDALLAVTDDAVGEILVSSTKPTAQQRRFLDGLIGMYERFATRDSDSPESQLFTAQALVRVGRLQARVRRYPEADKAFSDALARLSPDPTRTGDNWDRARGFAHLYFGILKLQRGDDGAEGELLAAREAYAGVVAKSPKPDDRFRLSQCDDRLGVFYLTQKKYSEAGERQAEAYAVREALAKEFPEEPEYQYRLAQSLRQKVAVLNEEGKGPEALATGKRAVNILERLVDANPTSAAFLAQLADVQTLLTEVAAGPVRTELRFGKVADDAAETESLAFAKAAQRTWGRLVAFAPGDPDFRRKLAEANLNVAEHAFDSGNARTALVAVDAARTMLDELNAESPGTPLTEELLGHTMLLRASLFRGRANPRAAEAAKEAVAYAEKLVLASPDDDRLRSLSLGCHLEEEVIHRAGKRPAEAAKSFEAAWAQVNALAKLGSSDRLVNFARVAAEGYMERKDDAGAIEFAKKIAALPLPGGIPQYRAACFLGHMTELVKIRPDYNEETDLKRFQPLWSHCDDLPQLRRRRRISGRGRDGKRTRFDRHSRVVRIPSARGSSSSVRDGGQNGPKR